jgi:acrylyl-CoA reductase (NADPH)
MPELPSSVPALLADASGEETRLELTSLSADDLGDGDVVVAVSWSSVNYKDGLASRKDGKVARIDPLVPGIDLAGAVVEPGASGLAVGAPVIVHGYDLGVAHHGGYAAYARVPAGWVVPLPDGLTERQAMTLGTAGFTAALSIVALEEHGLAPGAGPVLVTGATGGVGSVALSILAARGYEVTAVTGKPDAADWLRSLGAAEVVDRAAIGDASRPLRKETWAGAVDCVGGETLAAVLASLRYGAAVAASGNTGGVGLPTTVFPSILRGAALLGIDSVQCPIERRRAVWARLADDLRPPVLDGLATDEVALADVPAALERILAGGARGRTLVKVS